MSLARISCLRLAHRPKPPPRLSPSPAALRVRTCQIRHGSSHIAGPKTRVKKVNKYKGGEPAFEKPSRNERTTEIKSRGAEIYRRIKELEKREQEFLRREALVRREEEDGKPFSSHDPAPDIDISPPKQDAPLPPPPSLPKPEEPKEVKDSKEVENSQEVEGSEEPEERLPRTERRRLRIIESRREMLESQYKLKPGADPEARARRIQAELDDWVRNMDLKNAKRDARMLVRKAKGLRRDLRRRIEKKKAIPGRNDVRAARTLETQADAALRRSRRFVAAYGTPKDVAAWEEEVRSWQWRRDDEEQGALSLRPRFSFKDGDNTWGGAVGEFEDETEEGVEGKAEGEKKVEAPATAATAA